MVISDRSGACIPRQLDPYGTSAHHTGGRSRRKLLGGHMADRLKGKLAFCTASGAGIGRATAIAFAREGAKVIASDVDEGGFADLRSAGVAECVKLDARDTKAIEV